MASKGKDLKKAPELGILQGWWNSGIENSRKKRWDWFVIDQFLRGNHSIRGNPNDNSVVVARASESINFPINKIYQNFRAIRAFVTRNKPVINVEPENFEKAAIDYARQANSLLKRDNTKNNYEFINKEWSYYGLKYGVGYRQIAWDQKNHKTLRWSIDPFDLVICSKFGPMQDAPAIVKTFQRPIDYMKHKYPDADISPDNELSPDPYKKMALMLRYQEGGAAYDNDKQTVTGYEGWYRVFEPNSAGGYINICIWTKGGICDFIETPFTEYPFVPYYAEIAPNEQSGDGHLKQIIPAQRLFNLLNLQMLEYNHIVNRGRYLLDKNSGFRVINTKEGQLIFRNPGKKIESLSPPQINPLLERQLNMTVQFIDDLGGQHTASMGGTPERVSSGDAIDKLQIGDSNNISDLRDNFQLSLAEESAWILRMYSLFEKDGVMLHTKDGDQTKSYAVIGKEAYNKAETEIPDQLYLDDENHDVMAVLPDHAVTVSVISQLGESANEKRDFMLKLVELGVIPGKALLNHLEFPNVADLQQQLADEVASEIMAENMKGQQGQQGTPQQGMPPPGSPGVPPTEAPPPTPPEAGGGNNSLLMELQQLADHTGAMANGG